MSQWIRGDIVVSEIYDHTSTIQFLEEWLGLEPNPNISPWRRAMTGSMMAAFDFANPDYSWPDLPDTSDYVKGGDVQCESLPDVVVPTDQSMPKQEEGTKVYRALPYKVDVHGAIIDRTFELTINNTGVGGLPFALFDLTDLDNVSPRTYAVKGGKSLFDKVSLGDGDRYAFLLHSVNGFIREFAGLVKGSVGDGLEIKFQLVAEEDKVTVSVDSAFNDDVIVDIIDNAYGKSFESLTVKAGDSADFDIDVSGSSNWYDLSVSVGSDITECGEGAGVRPSMGGTANIARRFMGRLENGRDGTSDPAMGAGLRSMWEDEKAEGFSHAYLPAHLHVIKRNVINKHETKDSFIDFQEL